MNRKIGTSARASSSAFAPTGNNIELTVDEIRSIILELIDDPRDNPARERILQLVKDCLGNILDSDHAKEAEAEGVPFEILGRYRQISWVNQFMTGTNKRLRNLACQSILTITKRWPAHDQYWASVATKISEIDRVVPPVQKVKIPPGCTFTWGADGHIRGLPSTQGDSVDVSKYNGKFIISGISQDGEEIASSGQDLEVTAGENCFIHSPKRHRKRRR